MSAPTANPTFPPRAAPRAAEPLAAPPAPPAVERFTATSRMLRGAGSAALVAALSTFLWQHWQSGSDLVRAATLLAHSGALAAAGLFCGLRARDGKAARTFLGLAGASLPIVASVAGGLVYSQLAWDSLRPVPHYATWVAPSATAAWAAGLIAALGSAPIAGLCMGVFARRAWRPLAVAAVAGNALLLVPTRHPDAVAALAAASLAALAWLEWRWLAREPSLANFEGGVARALAWAPPLFLLGRSALHYDLSHLYAGVVGLAAAAGLTGLSRLPRAPGELRAAARWFAVIPAAWASVALSAALFSGHDPLGLALPLTGALFAAQLGLASLGAGGADWGRSFRQLAAAGVAGSCWLDLWLAPGVVSSLLAGSTSLVVLAWGTLRAQRGLQLLGAAGALCSVAVHVRLAAELYAWSRWGSLALLGAAVILAASWIERSGPAALARLERGLRRHGALE